MSVDLAVMGLGHLGLSLARAATAARIGTVGFDPDEHTIHTLRAGRPPAEAALVAADVRRMLYRGFHATTDPAVLGRARTTVICTSVPLDEHHALDLTALTEAVRTLAARLRPRTTVILESPVYPGDTETVLRPLLEDGSGLRAGRDFHLACAVGRPGPPGHDRAAAPRVLGGLTPACTEAAAAFYGRFTPRVVRARGIREAETVRALESTMGHLHQALLNEMAMVCHDLEVDLWDVVRCAETRAGAPQPLRPGGGLGGAPVAWERPTAPADYPPRTPGGLDSECHDRGRPLRLVQLAQEINDRMPGYVSRRAATLLNEYGKSVRGARVLLLGVTCLPDLPGQEGSPAREIAARLRALGAELHYHDPFVGHWQVGGRQVPRTDFPCEAAAEADLTLLLQHHRTYDLHGLTAKAQLVLDTCGVTPPGAAHRL